jgi:hypothetical protein
MDLTDRDVENAQFLEEALHARNRTHAISIALSLTKFIVSELSKPDTHLLLRNPDGSVSRVVMHELENIASK